MKEVKDKGKVVGYELNEDRENKGNVVEGYYEKQVRKAKPQAGSTSTSSTDVTPSKREGPIYPEYNPEHPQIS